MRFFDKTFVCNNFMQTQILLLHCIGKLFYHISEPYSNICRLMVAYSLFFHKLFRFSCTGLKKITLIKNPLGCYTFFLFRHSVRYFRHDLISVRNLLQLGRWCRWAWKINFKISGQLSKIKRLWICCDFLLIFKEILESVIFLIIVSFFYI